MSEKTRFVAVSPESIYSKRSLRIRAALAGVVFVAGGCSFGHDTPNVDSTEGPFAAFEPIQGDCDPSASGSVQALEERAKDCLDTYDNAEIALVNYAALTPEDAEKVATDAAVIIETSTDGMIQPTIEVIPASQEAIAAFEKQIAGDGCVEGNSLEDYASYTADATMDLAKYDTIAGITNASSCTEGVKGVANGQYNRYVEVFEAADDMADFHANNDGYEVDEEGRPKYLPNVSVELAHEIFHKFNLDHFGQLYGGELGRSIDLPTYVHDAFYQEYGSDNVMGIVPYLAYDFDLTPSQMYLLEWPQRRLEYETRMDAFDLAEQAVAFSSEDDANSIAILELNPVSFSIPEVVEGFDRLIFEPQLSDDGRARAVKVFLVSGNDRIAFVGELYEMGTHQLEVGDGIVTVEVTGEAVNLSYEAED